MAINIPKPEIITGTAFIQEFCKAHGLDSKHIRSIEIKAHIQHVVSVKFEVIGDDRLYNLTQGAAIKKIIDKGRENGRLGLIDLD